MRQARKALIGLLWLLGLKSPAAAQQAKSYQLVVVPGAAQVSEDLVRINKLTGASVLIVGQTASTPIFEPVVKPIVEASPPASGDYELLPWDTFDTAGANRAWAVYRFDARSGRLWALKYGNGSASWREIILAEP